MNNILFYLIEYMTLNEYGMSVLWDCYTLFCIKQINFIIIVVLY